MNRFDLFPQLSEAISDGISRRLHTGVQVYVSLDQQPVLDDALGFAAPGRPMTRDTLMPWRSAGKPLTSVLVMQLVERDVLLLDSTLGELLPEAVGTDKQTVTVQNLLTHVAGFPATETGWPVAAWDESVGKAVTSPRTLDVGTAAYHPQSSWFVLGEIIRRFTPCPAAANIPSMNSSFDSVQMSEITLEWPPSFSAVLHRELLAPLGLRDTHCQIAESRIADFTDGLPTLYERNHGELVESVYSQPLYATCCSPGGGLRGPVRELGRFYEMLLRGGLAEPRTRLLDEASVRQMTSRHREGQFDQTLQHVVDFGLGLIIDSNRHGADTVPYGFGRCCSPSSFGHGGSQCSMAFCDPVRRLVVAWSTNGFCGEGQHQRRNRLLNEAIFTDLGFNRR